MLTGTQCRMGRAAVKMTVDDLAKEAHVSRATILRFERGDGVIPAIKAALRTALEKSGVHFQDNGSVKPPSEKEVA